MVDEGDANFNELLQSINYQERKTFGIIIWVGLYNKRIRKKAFILEKAIYKRNPVNIKGI
jgi:hypothetical protein